MVAPPRRRARGVRARRDLATPRRAAIQRAVAAAVEPRRQHRRAGDRAGRHRLEPGPSGCRDARARLDRRRARRDRRPAARRHRHRRRVPRPGAGARPRLRAPGRASPATSARGSAPARAGVIAIECRDRCSARDPTDSPTRSRVAPTSTEPRMPETTARSRRTRPRRPRSTGSRHPARAVAARRARAAVKADVASARQHARSSVLREAFEPTRRRRGAPARAPSSSPASPRSARGKTRPHHGRARDLAASKRLGGLGRLQRRRLREFLADCGGRATAAAASRLVVLAGPTAVGKGTVAAYIRRAPSRGAAVGLGDDAPAAARRGRRRALLLRRRRRVRPAWSRRASCSSGRPCTTRTATARRARPIEEALAAGDSVLLEIDIQGARPVRRADARGDARVPAAADAGTNSCAGSSAEAPRAPPSSSAGCGPRRSNWRPSDEFDHQVVNHDVGEAAQEVVDLMQAPASGRR